MRSGGGRGIESGERRSLFSTLVFYDEVKFLVGAVLHEHKLF